MLYICPEIQIAVHSVGICGSDVHYLTHGAIGDFVVNAPMLLGHESSGTVTKLGEGVVNLKVGKNIIFLLCHTFTFAKFLTVNPHYIRF